MPEGGVLTIAVDHLRAALASEAPVADYVRVIVTDTGYGMDAETLARAAEPFFSTKELGKGTGLGLSMVQGLAVQLNGALRLSSEVGRGTTAELWLRSEEHTSELPSLMRNSYAVICWKTKNKRQPNKHRTCTEYKDKQ